MRYPFYLLLFFVFLCQETAQAQTDGQLPDHIEYHAWVKTLDGKNTTTRRFLTHVQDSLVILGNDERSESTRFYYYNIDHLSLRRKGQSGRGFLIGAIGGFVTGFVLGYAEAANCSGYLCFSPTGVGALTGGIGAIPGGLIGAAIGSARITIPINGQTKNQRQEIFKKIKF